VSDVYGDFARSTYHSLQLTVEKRRSDDGLTVTFNCTFSRTKDNLTARTGYNFDQDWSVGVNDQPHIWNALVVYNVPFGRGWQAGQRQQGRAGDRQGLADLRDHTVPIGPSARFDCGRLRHATRGADQGATRVLTAGGSYWRGKRPPEMAARVMFSGIASVLVAAAASVAVFALWVAVFPGAVMLVVLYLCRLIPLVGRRRKGKSSGRTDQTR
jgi:hypothetical protein